MALTIRDVAKEAGVSIATVSRALRGHTSISERTRNHVQAVADRMGYTLPVRNSGQADASSVPKVAVIVPYIGRWYFAKIIEGIDAVTRERGFEVVILRVADSIGTELPLSGHLDAFEVQGALVVSQHLSDSDYRLLQLRNIPTVLVDLSDPRFTTVGIDDVAVGRRATEHLLELGHTKIAIVTGDPHDLESFTTPGERRLGYLQTLRAAGIEPRPEWEIHADFTARSADHAVRSLLAGPDLPTAVFAASDEMALGVMGAARKLGLSVPGDLSVIGVDDHDVSEAMGLTTISQPIAAMAEIAAWQLLSRISGGNEFAGRITLPTELVVRESTAPPKA